MTKEWVELVEYNRIFYGMADVLLYFTSGVGLNMPIPWFNPLQDNDVEAPDQLGI